MPTEQEIREFQYAAAEPPDFDDFWRRVRRDLDATPLEPEVTPAPLRSLPHASVHEARYTSLDGVRIACWYVVPRNGRGPFPTLINFPGYQSEPALTREWAERGVITLSVAYRGKLRSHRQFNPGYPGFMTHGIESRETYSYKGVYADAMRAVDFLLTRQEVDATRLFVHGLSAGGGLSIITTALRPEVRAAVAGCPFMCAFSDALALTRAYPYNEVICYLRAYPERRKQVMETLSYFDAVNFAKRVRQPVSVEIGMEDEVCPPQTSYAAYSALRSGEKEVWLAPDAGHGSFPGYAEWEAARLRKLMDIR